MATTFLEAKQKFPVEKRTELRAGTNSVLLIPPLPHILPKFLTLPMDIHFFNFILAGIILTSAALSSAFASSGEVRVSFTDLAYNFTLSAWNTTLPNVNETGAPLVLGQNGKVSTFFGCFVS